ncbi:MAG: inorganic phosphate transporter, partial [Gammaproteobacteria bacterium]
SPGGGFEIPLWIVLLCAVVMAMGTAGGGWRIIRTVGQKMVRLHPVDGFVAEACSALIIFVASAFGIPISTTQIISPAIMGVGAAKRFNAVHWTVVERMVWAWLLTLPITAVISWGISRVFLAL